MPTPEKKLFASRLKVVECKLFRVKRSIYILPSCLKIAELDKPNDSPKDTFGFVAIFAISAILLMLYQESMGAVRRVKNELSIMIAKFASKHNTWRFLPFFEMT
jgi:hypothetical protein